MDLARRLLGSLSRGVEIGASAVSPFPGVRAWNLDHPDGELFQDAQRAIALEPAPIDVLATADRLPIGDGALEFLLASHVVEHMPDTLRALAEWDRVLEVGGLCFLIVPHKERTFDRDRPRTDLRHHLADFATGRTAATDPMVPTSHYHVWVTEDFVRLVEYLNGEGYLDWELVEVEDVDSKVGNGFTIVARKRSVPPPLERQPGGEVDFHMLTLALPFQVPGRTLETIVPGPSLPERLHLARGTYRVVPVLSGFPPRAGAPFELELGGPIEPPVVEDYDLVDERLLMRGRNLTATTWLEARYPDGHVRPALPEYEDGVLVLDLAGLAVPEKPFPVTPVNSPPGGGPGPAFWFERDG